jgi:hypothetical protein
MKLAFARSGARDRRALQSVASFYAKGLILVEHPEMDGLNKEIKRRRGLRHRLSILH